MLKTWAYSTCFISGIASSLYCDLPQPSRATVRHIESKGIGYKHGYTSLDLFLSPSDPFNCRFVPFLDLRGHLFDNGDPAANAGLGLRFLLKEWIFGVNGYYDYRQTKHDHVYNQASAGIEVMNACWGLDFRINGYLPFGDRFGKLFSPEFGGFEDHFMLLRFKQDIAMRGGNAEIGYHVPFKNPNVDLYFAGGSYYLQGRGRPAVGGQLRFALDLWNYVRLEANASYDKVFKWIGQGQVGISVPFGGSGSTQCGCNPCIEHVIRNRLSQRVDRFEIIALDRQTPLRLAIDPDTQSPYRFWFVNGNNTNGNGTFELPFNNLISAEAASSTDDVIYVFPTKVPPGYSSQGITLKDNQKLLGSGIDHTLLTTVGKIKVPKLSLTTPLIVSTSLDGISGPIVCSNNNEIAGFTFFTDENISIVAQNITDLKIHDNSFTLSPGLGIALDFSNGNILIEDNSFNFDGPFSLAINLTTLTPGNYTINANQFIGSDSSSFDARAIAIGNSNGDFSNFGSLTISNNLFSGLNPLNNNTIRGFLEGPGEALKANNLFLKQTSTPNVVRLTTRGGPVNVSVLDNRWAFSGNIPTSLRITNQSDVCVSFAGNVSEDQFNPAYIFDNQLGDEFILNDDGSNIGDISTNNVTSGTCY